MSAQRLQIAFTFSLLRDIAAEASLQRSALSWQSVIQRINALTLVSCGQQAAQSMHVAAQASHTSMQALYFWLII